MVIPLGSLRFHINLMAEYVHHIERVEFAVPFDVPGTDQIRLVNVIATKRLGKVRVLFPFGNIRSFF